ncbi:MAG: DUF4292 domain-containing protein [Taibaiella sp.]|nr:DUF4292 domain-containing protein [Taibaiella sp.]
MNRYVAPVVLMMIMLGSMGCKMMKIAKRPIPKKASDSTLVVRAPMPDTTHPVTTQPIPDAARQALIAGLTPLWKKTIDFNTFSGKVKMHYIGQGQNVDFTAHIRIKKDNIIWITVTALEGIVQVARVYVTPDSFKLVNFIKNEATVIPITEAAKFLPIAVTFANLQNFLMGDALVKEGTITDASTTSDVFLIQVATGNYTQHITYNKADSTMRSAQVSTPGSSGLQGLTTFSNYAATDALKFSTDREVNIHNAGQVYELEMSFKSATFNQPQDYPFSIPHGYTISR